jgi:PAS domain S-box-containing protein
VGRKEEFAQLGMAFDWAIGGASGVVIIPGASGSGKTSLVEAMKPTMEAKNGRLITGKFDQFTHTQPFFALTEAMRQLWFEIEQGATWNLSEWRSSMEEHLGPLAPLLAQLIPEMKPYVPPLSATEVSLQEARLRFARVIAHFLSFAAQPHRPLVLFLDDCQWADPGSLELIRQLNADPELTHFLLIIAYRHNEVAPTHPLKDLIDRLHSQASHYLVIPVEPLNASQMAELFHMHVPHPLEDADSWHQLLFETSQGNPFFASALLSHWNQRGYFRSNTEPDTGPGPENLRENLPLTPQELFRREMDDFPSEWCHLLHTAALLGNTFDAASLGFCCDLDSTARSSGLKALHAAGWMQRRPPKRWGNSDTYCFVHDSFQQAAYHWLPPEAVAIRHLEVATILQQALDEEAIEDRLFEIAEHLTQAVHLLQDEPGTMDHLLILCRATGKAREATAYHIMLTFSQSALAALRHLDWERRFREEQPHRWTQLWIDAAESAFLNGQRDLARQLLDQVVIDGPALTDRIRALIIQIIHDTLQARYDKAIESGRAALAMLQIELPTSHFEEARDAILEEVLDHVQTCPREVFLEAPPMSDPQQLMAIRVLITLGPPCYRSHPKLWSVLVPLVVQKTLVYGIVPEIGYSHTALAGLLCWVHQDFEHARWFGTLGSELMASRFAEDFSAQSVFWLMTASSFQPWFESQETCSRGFQEAYHFGLKSGNLQYAAYAFGHDMTCCLLRGMPLNQLIPQTRQSLQFSRNRHNQWAIDLLSGGLFLMEALQENRSVSPVTVPPDWSYVEQVKRHQNTQVLCFYLILKAQTAYLLGNLEQAAETLEQAEPLIESVGTQGLLPWPEFRFLHCIVAAQQKAPHALSVFWFQSQLVWFERWQQVNPKSVSPKVFFIRALWAVYDGRVSQALDHFLSAYRAWGTLKNLPWQAHAMENMARLLALHQEPLMSDTFFRQSMRLYARWGAHAKVGQMQGQRLNTALIKRSDYQRGTPLVGLLKQLLEQDDPEMEHQFHKEKLQADSLTKATQQLRREMAIRRQAEEKVLKNERRLAGLLRNLPGIAYRWQVQDPQPLDFISDGVLPLTGYASGELQAHPEWYQNRLIHPEDREEVRRTLGEALKRGEPFQLIYRLLTKDGQVRWVMEQGSGAYHGETLEAIEGFISDITQEKQAEEERLALEKQVLHTQKLESLGILAGGVAHDFNNILTIILGNLELLKCAPSPSKQATFMDNIEKAARRASDLARQMLDYAGKGQLERRPVHLNETLEELLPLIRASLPKTVVVDLQLAPGCPAFSGDPTQIRQVLMNLIINAAEAMNQEPGTITILTKTECLDRDQQEHLAKAFPPQDLVSEHQRRFLYCSVSDTGSGMTTEVMQQIFDPFFTTKFTGRGLGLSAVMGIVNVHQGLIRVYSEPGQGTRFEWWIPLSPSEGEPQRFYHLEPPKDQARPGTGRVLVVDDEEAIGNVAQRYLELLGFSASYAGDGQQGLMAFKHAQPPFSLILMDYAMPVLDGRGMLNALRKEFPRLPVILCSGYSEDEAIATILKEDPCCTFLAKPYTLNSLRAAIAAVCPGCFGGA